MYHLHRSEQQKVIYTEKYSINSSDVTVTTSAKHHRSGDNSTVYQGTYHQETTAQ